MYKYYDALLNRSGDALAGHFVRLFDAGGSPVDIYADESLTPIITDSGVANAAKSDDDGMVRFYVPSGEYDIRLYDATDTFVTSERAVPMVKGVSELTLAEPTAAADIGEANDGNVQAALDGKVPTADLISDSGSTMVGYKRATGVTFLRPQQEKNDDVANILDFIHPDEHNKIISGDYAGQDSDNIADGFVNALADGPFRIPRGQLMVRDTIPCNYGTDFGGAGRQRTLIRSDIPGGPLFDFGENKSFCRIGDFTLYGNNKDDEFDGPGTGSGHAIAGMDTAGGAWSPSQLLIENIEVRYFKGRDLRSTASTDRIHSAAIALVGALGVTVRKVYAYQCGHGAYLDATQSCNLDLFEGEEFRKYGILAINTDCTIITNPTLVACGDGTTDTGYAAAGTDLRTGAIGSYRNQGFEATGIKAKTGLGCSSLVNSLFSPGDKMSFRWFRPDQRAYAPTGFNGDAPHKGIYVERSPGSKFEIMSFPGQAYSGRKYQIFEALHTQNNEVMDVKVTGNFEDVSGAPIEYNVKIGGNSGTRKIKADVSGCVFGSREGRSSASTVDDDILLSSCTLVEGSNISGNLHQGSSNVTRTNGVRASSVTLTKTTIGPNAFVANGTGVITNNYNGISEGNLTAISSSYDPPSLATAASTPIQTTTVTGAALGDVVTASWSASLAGAEIKAYVSAANTVSWYITNTNGANPLDLASGTATLRVKRSWAA